MTLISYNFLLFIIIVFVIYYLVPKKLQWIVLLLSSIYFLLYDSLSIQNIICILIVLLTSFFGAILIEKYSDTKRAKRILILGIILILGQLIYLKYTNFILMTCNYIFNLFNINYTFELIPSRNPTLGVSYYSLIMLSYLTNVYWKITKPQKNILKCALFMSYFPILTNGPFIRYDNTGKELFEPHKIDSNKIWSGIIRILYGIFKFLVISERLAVLVNTIYGDYITYSGLYIVLAALFYVIELYTNFSGSIDIVIGISEMFGISLPENFNAPFFSRTITEFWRNWHITLGDFLREYVFYPIQKSNIMQKIGKSLKETFGKKFAKKFTLYLSMFIMWLIIGIWHGGNYTFIIGSGILQFVYILLEGLLAPFADKINKKLGIDSDSIGYKLYQCIRTYILFAFAMIFFSSSSVSEAILIIKNIFESPSNFNLFNLGLNSADYIIIAISIVFLFIFDKANKDNKLIEKIHKYNTEAKITIICTFILIILLFGMYGIGFNVSDFIYSKF